MQIKVDQKQITKLRTLFTHPYTHHNPKNKIKVLYINTVVLGIQNSVQCRCWANLIAHISVVLAPSACLGPLLSACANCILPS